MADVNAITSTTTNMMPPSVDGDGSVSPVRNEVSGRSYWFLSQVMRRACSDDTLMFRSISTPGMIFPRTLSHRWMMVLTGKRDL